MSKKKARAAERAALVQSALAGWGVAPVPVTAPPAPATVPTPAPRLRPAPQPAAQRAPQPARPVWGEPPEWQPVTVVRHRPAHQRRPLVVAPPPVTRTVGTTRLVVAVGDITGAQVDAIVNAANSGLWAGGGVCGAIHRAAGPGLAAACAKLVAAEGEIGVGEAAITPGFRLAAPFVIHAVGPVWGMDEPGLLWDTVANALALAADYDARTVALPLISTGIYGMPLDVALPYILGALLAAARTTTPPFTELRLITREAEKHPQLVRALDELLAAPPAPVDPAPALAAAPARRYTYRAEYRRCGKPGCHCATDAGHGPYWFAYWTADGKTRRQYLGRHRIDLDDAGATPGAEAANG